MTHPDPDLLVDAALDQPVAAEVTAHLAACPGCATEVDQLRRAAHGIRGSAVVEFVAPPAEVWSSIETELADLAPTGGSAVPVRRPGHPRRWNRLALAAACAAGIAVGGLTTYALTRPPEPPEVTTESVAELAPLGQPGTVGRAELTAEGSALSLHVNTEPLDPGAGYLEVWLINRDLTRMTSVGVLPRDGHTSGLPLDRRLIDEGYVIVDISREDFDDKPQHSGQTLARGTLHRPSSL